MENRTIDTIGTIEENRESILSWVKSLKFKKKIFGGVDEADVLKKMEELNDLYERALLQQRAGYEALLQQYRGGGKADGN